MYAPCTTSYWLVDPEARTRRRWDTILGGEQPWTPGDEGNVFVSQTSLTQPKDSCSQAQDLQSDCVCFATFEPLIQVKSEAVDTGRGFLLSHTNPDQ